MKTRLIFLYFAVRHLSRRLRKYLIRTLFSVDQTNPFLGEQLAVIDNINKFGIAQTHFSQLAFSGNVNESFHNSRKRASSLLAEMNLLEQKIDHTDEQAKDFKVTITDLFLKEDLINIITDPKILDIVRGYFKTEAYLNQAEVWWDRPVEGEERDSQNFHVDGEDPLLLKVFIYFTDVKDGDGPFTYVKKSHKTIRQTYFILRYGVASIPESRLSNKTKLNIIQGIESSGTIFFADTNGLHRGAKISQESKGRILMMLSFVSKWPIRSSKNEESLLPFTSAKDLMAKNF
ncbi:hypothetical protein N9T10_02185 [Pseudomonadota bacterium]|nr:hypothetical protein [Pseudomonadota bacterium]